jgi:uncharacterized protein YggU (UPF0235/DUF167 family)
LRLSVRLTPRGGADRVDGWARDDAARVYLKVRVRAAAVDGAANAALEALIAKSLGIARSAVRLAAGRTARIKQLEIDGVDDAQVERLFGLKP